jgi:hypothetical protein
LQEIVSFRGAAVRIAFLLCALLIAAPAYSQEGGPKDGQSQTEPGTETAPADNPPGGLQQLPPPSSEPVVPIINIYPGKYAGEETQCASPKDWKDWQDWSAWNDWGGFSLCRSWEWMNPERVLAVWAVILGIATFLLLLATRTLLKDASNARARQERDSRLLQRAYLSVQPDGVRRLFRPPETAQASISIVNAGNLPARNIGWVINQAFSNDDGLKDFPVSKAKAEGAHVVVPRSQMIQSGPPFPAGLGTFATPESSSQYLYVWGAVFYNDGFGDNRTTRFCHRYNGISYNGSSDVIAEHGRLHSHGNDAN